MEPMWGLDLGHSPLIVYWNAFLKSSLNFETNRQTEQFTEVFVEISFCLETN